MPVAKRKLRGLEIGPGDNPRQDTAEIVWQRAGVNPNDGQLAYRWGDHRLMVEDGSFDIIYASHVIEHVDWRRVHDALTDSFRLLVPGGIIELWTMDVRKLVQAYLRGECGDDWRRSNPDGDPFRWFVARLHAYGPPDGTEANWHRGQFDSAYLMDCLERAGFVGMEDLPPRHEGSHGACEMGMRAMRPL